MAAYVLKHFSQVIFLHSPNSKFAHVTCLAVFSVREQMWQNLEAGPGETRRPAPLAGDDRSQLSDSEFQFVSCGALLLCR
mmetsp:Transcript_11634/g.48399  ORF Transcript_11634/g.48399 Transcript_11634/m.48399 type:complete len:80 (-) Transcript_11634:1447-1686(-)